MKNSPYSVKNATKLIKKRVAEFSKDTPKDSKHALRFDTGKPEFHHIHPHAWSFMIEKQDSKIKLMSDAMDEYFYYNDTQPLFGIFSSLLLQDHVESMVRVLEFGSRKYASLNYTKGMKFSRVLNSFRRHTWADLRGEECDVESGISHLGHAMCNVMFMLLYSKLYDGSEFDDRILLNETNEDRA